MNVISSVQLHCYYIIVIITIINIRRKQVEHRQIQRLSPKFVTSELQYQHSAPDY